MESLSDQNLDLINAAIHRLMEETYSGRDKDPLPGPESEDDRRLLSKLLSQLETLKGDSAANPLKEPSVEAKDTGFGAGIAGECAENSDGKPEAARASQTDDEIVKELKEVRRQNTITHWLLSIMIVLTLAWQVSEVSLIWKLKDGISHPFRSVGGMLAGMFKGGTTNGRNGDDYNVLAEMFKGGAVNGRDGDGDESPGSNQSEMLPIPAVKIPELPKFDITDISSNGEEKK